VTRKDETAGKVIVNGPQGYRERASRCEATEGQAGRDIRRARCGERVMVSRRRRGKFGESSGHATIRRTGTNWCHSPLTYPNPMQKTETSSNPPFPFRLPSLGASYSSASASISHSIFIASRFWFIFFRVSLSLFLSFSLESCYPPLITLSFLPHYIIVSLHVTSRSYSCDIVGTARLRDGSPVGGIIDLAWRYIPVVLCAPRYAHPCTE